MVALLFGDSRTSYILSASAAPAYVTHRIVISTRTPHLTPNIRRSRGWMMTWSSLACILGSVLFLLAFLAAVVFVDPSTYFGSEDLDFCALTSVFFTLDMLPLVFLLFSNDAKVPNKCASRIRTQSREPSVFGKACGGESSFVDARAQMSKTMPLAPPMNECLVLFCGGTEPLRTVARCFHPDISVMPLSLVTHSHEVKT